jgi:PAS domain-containing protein
MGVSEPPQGTGGAGGAGQASGAAHGDIDASRLPLLDAGAQHDGLCRIARELFGCPTARVVLSGEDRADEEAAVDGWPEGICGGFAARVMATGAPLVVPDASQDARFSDEVVVTAYPFIRFYAGAPVHARCGRIIGVFSLVDYRARPHGLSAADLDLLAAFAAIAADQLDRALLERSRGNERAQLLRAARVSTAALIEIGTDGRISTWNDSARRLLKAAPEIIEGSPVHRFLPGWDGIAADCLAALARGTQDRDHGASLVEILTTDGRLEPMRATPSCWLEDGRVRYRLVLEPVG